MRCLAFAAFASLAILAGCAGLEPAGRSAASAPPSSASAPQPAAEPAPAADGAQQISPTVTLPAPPPQPARPAADNEVVIPGVRETQVQPPNGDPRTAAERMADISAWDRCVTRVHNQGEADPMKPQLDDPEAYCRQALGMASRTAVPASRRP
ncbi:MAG TPA: hypothetical protein VG841_05760 [Caulobacterales bacterium]|nr:hypothetical protein [Caulobacterales bacterium]